MTTIAETRPVPATPSRTAGSGQKVTGRRVLRSEWANRTSDPPVLAVSGDDAAGGLVGHPATARLFHAGQRVRQWDTARPWALDTAVVVAIFLAFCLPDLPHDGDPPDTPIPFVRPPLAEMLLFQAALLVPLWWRRRAPLAAFHAVMAAFVVELAVGVLLRADVALLVAVYSLVLHAPLRRLPWAVPASIATFCCS
ncbi:hypothetical protein Franean1_6694 [Parafrankia sp. EAN1pec]|uniref:DUF7134 domain-containing protein n=1 Tax=Parafrankia sp. (strain EAN1pec) TaxID=298653 RepID=UPI000054402B|nr:hypothetical protein Franean1_6694 [Frankia sp. EAN1pec]